MHPENIFLTLFFYRAPYNQARESIKKTGLKNVLKTDKNPRKQTNKKKTNKQIIKKKNNNNKIKKWLYSGPSDEIILRQALGRWLFLTQNFIFYIALSVSGSKCIKTV